MSIERFRQLADTWGAERTRWPAAERELHRQYAATPEGRDILARAAELDDFLDGLETRPPDPLRAARIARAARKPRLQRRQIAWLSGAWAASAVLGFTLGYLTPATDQDSGDDVYVQLLNGGTVLEDFL